MNATSKLILPIIVISQFFCTSLWFAGNSVMHDLITSFGIKANDLGYITSVVQFGFITGTLTFAILSVVDRYSPSKVFLFSAVIGALFNLGVIWNGNNLTSILILRFFTGFFLAGIYPVGMKIASDYYDKNLGKSLGFLVGALVLGTAFPHLLKEISISFSWKFVLITTSTLAILGGLLIGLKVPDGPYRKPSTKMQLFSFFKIFEKKEFRSASTGYFGHMWELYAFWAFIPIILKAYIKIHPNTTYNIALSSFLIIAIGAIACVVSGYIAQILGNKKTAFISLFLSCICCLVSPFIFSIESETIFLLFLLFWGSVVIADSPLFSTLVAQNAPIELKGSALTIVNCIGYSITIISIQLINTLITLVETNYVYMILALGPIIGLAELAKKNTK